MCMNTLEKLPSPPSFHAKRKQRSKKHKLQVLGLITRRKSFHEEEEEEEGKDMELMNLKLYLENQTIVEENEKLRKKANLLHHENLALFSEFQKKFPLLNKNTTS